MESVLNPDKEGELDMGADNLTKIPWSRNLNHFWEWRIEEVKA